ncbi:hypothetical protein M407DRAFT_152052 [Tulasnella calospora MUT 4182]|uniref:A to I editase domain-containing protein n=1 Tax=Tulasnella calospora MUT 4182 TaxID=1051891 RepID=A0A0C3M9Y5_9AGAM|nr:hypothetical protein M407DRAFT_152052 [Tulasnella calospora MUT 4182]
MMEDKAEDKTSIDTDAIAQLCISTYLGLPKSFHPVPRSNGTPQWCILAGIVLSKPTAVSSNDLSSSFTDPDSLKCISLGTGTKCLPEAKLPPNGDILHDSHAEVLARRGAIRWFYEEIVRWKQGQESSDWIERDEEDGLLRLKRGVQVHMYVSTLPCGDASTLLLSFSQDPAMAERKETSRLASLYPTSEAKPTVGRGRDDYSALGVLRTKPGRADSPPTISMSCSDKIASWTLLGLQGALLSQFMQPVYLNTLIFGEVEPGLEPTFAKECERAFATRLHSDIEFSHPFHQHEPRIAFTSVLFPSSRSQTGNNPITGASPVSKSESITWIADTNPPIEALVDGRKRGSSMKAKPIAYRSRISKAALFDLYLNVESVMGINQLAQLTYYEAKQMAVRYQDAKKSLRGKSGPLAGWMISGHRWEGFNALQPSVDK